jgi:hypothetical protein
MRFAGQNKLDAERAKTYLQHLIKQGRDYEVSDVKPRRSRHQNAYLHLLFGWFALEYGESTEYVKQVIFKRVVNTEIFLYERANRKTGELRDDYRSTADLDSRELTIAIDRFRDYAAKEAGIYLPAPNEEENLASIEREMSKYSNRIYT